MINHNFARALLTCGVVMAGFGCSAGASGPGGDSELTRESNALTSQEPAGVYACQVTNDAYADCMVDPTFPVYSSYFVTTTPDDGSKGWTFEAKTEITGPSTSAGTPVRLGGGGWKGVWSWKPAEPAAQSKGLLSPKAGSPTRVMTCLTSFCYLWATADKAPPGRMN